METLGEYLKRIRKNKQKLSLRELGRRVGISHSYLSQIENENTKKPKLYILRALAQELDIDYKILMYKAGYIDDEDYYRQDYVKEKSKPLSSDFLTAHEKSIDMTKLLLDEKAKIIFHNTSLTKIELDFLYHILTIITEENKNVSEDNLKKILEIIKILLR